MNWYMPPDRSHPGRAIGIIGLAVAVGVAFFISDRDLDQRREIAQLASEIARLSETCPAAEAGEQLVSTVLTLGEEKPVSIRCIYAATSTYGRSMRSRPAVPGRPS